MELSALAGNAHVKAVLSQQEGGRGLSHAYILSGPAGSGRHTLARLLCGAMLCTASSGERPCGRCAPCRKVSSGVHPDVTVISGPGEGKPITVDQVRALRSDAYIRPNEGERKIYLLEQADRMNQSAQNAMLKLLEEGPAYAVFSCWRKMAAACSRRCAPGVRSWTWSPFLRRRQNAGCPPISRTRIRRLSAGLPWSARGCWAGG